MSAHLRPRFTTKNLAEIMYPITVIFPLQRYLEMFLTTIRVIIGVIIGVKMVVMAVIGTIVVVGNSSRSWCSNSSYCSIVDRTGTSCIVNRSSSRSGGGSK